MKVTLVFTALLVASTTVISAPSGDYGAIDNGYATHHSASPSTVSVKSDGYQAPPAPAVAPVATNDYNKPAPAEKPAVAPVASNDYNKPAPAEKPADTGYKAPAPASVVQQGYQTPSPVVVKSYEAQAPVDNGYAKVENVAIKSVENVNAYTTPTPTTTPCATETVHAVATTPCDEKTADAAPTQYQDVAIKTVDAYEAIPTSLPTSQYNDIASRYSDNQGGKSSLYGQSSDAGKVTSSAFAILLVSGVGLLAL